MERTSVTHVLYMYSVENLGQNIFRRVTAGRERWKRFSLHWAKWKRCLSWSLEKWCHLTGIRYTVYLSGLKSLIHFNRVFHYKPSILGYPYFWNPPITSRLQPTSKSCDTLKTTNLQPEGLSSLLWNLGPVRTSLLHLGRRVKNGGKREGWLFLPWNFW